VKLNRWTEEFLKRQRKFPASEHVKKPLEQLFRSIANIRHAAVHRIRVSAKGLEQFLLDAEALAILLGDAEKTEKIAKLRRETQATMEELQRNKHFLRSRLEETLRGIAAQREELKHLEGIAIAEMEREDREYQILAGKSVDDAIAPSEASFSTAIDTEKETVTGVDETDDMDEDEDDVDQPGDAWDMNISGAAGQY
jgi:flagellar motility protein MotE (MotC chaperone)